MEMCMDEQVIERLKYISHNIRLYKENETVEIDSKN